MNELVFSDHGFDEDGIMNLELGSRDTKDGNPFAYQFNWYDYTAPIEEIDSMYVENSDGSVRVYKFNDRYFVTWHDKTLYTLADLETHRYTVYEYDNKVDAIAYANHQAEDKK